MTALGEELVSWLRSLKLSKDLTTTDDFNNGFYFGQIFNRLGLRRNRQFHNKDDMSCVFHNYKTTKELMMENFNIEIPVDNLIYRSKEILGYLKKQAIKLEQARKQPNQKTLEMSTPSLLQEKLTTMRKDLTSQLGMSSTQGMPKKIYEIEAKLQKFKDEKVKHELLALQQRRKQIQQHERSINMFRDHQRQQLRKNHEFVKTMDSQIYEGWLKNERTKQERIEKQRKFNEFMMSKKIAFTKSLRDQDEKDFREGVETFEMNCLKLGIDIDKDLTTVIEQQKQPKRPFNNVAFLQRIRDKNEREELARKQKAKRENNMNIEQQRTAKKAQDLFSEQAMVERYFKLSATEAASVQQYRNKILKKQLQQKKREQQALKNANKQYNIVFDEEKQKLRQQQMKIKRIQYMEQNYDRKVRKRQRHTFQMSQVLQAILDVAQQCYTIQNGSKSLEVPYKDWLKLMDKFIQNEPQNQKNKSISKNPSLKKKTISRLSKVDIQADKTTSDYVNEENQWQPLSYEVEDMRREAIGEPLKMLIDKIYPSLKGPEKSTIPLYMPVKLGVTGSSLSGRRTQAAKLANRYGLVVIDPNDIIKQAILLANPPPVQEKKGGKKEAKKVQQEKSEKAQLKEFGMKIKDIIKPNEQPPVEIILEAISLKIKQNFQQKSNEQIIDEFKEATKKQTQRFNQAMKEFEDNSKKKKDPKKPSEPEQPPKPNRYPYTKGFVLVGFPTTINNAKAFQKVIGGYVNEEELFNQQAQKEQQKYQQMVKFPQRKVDTKLKNGTLDYVFLLDASRDKLDARNQGRKIDPTNGQVYHMQFNPPPTDVKGLVQRLTDLPEVAIKEINTEDIKKYYSNRGVEETGTKCLQVIDANDTIVNVYKLLDTHIDTLAQHKAEKLVKIEESLKEPTTEENKPQEQVKKQETDPSANSISVQKSTKLLNMLTTIRDSYNSDVRQAILSFSQCRSGFLSRLEEIQNDFLDIILRPDDKIKRIKTFQDTYNKIIEEKESLVQIQQAKSHLLQKLDGLYDGLWQSISAKKDQGIQQRKNLIQSTWIQGEALAITTTCQKLMQAQVNKSTQTIEFIIRYLMAQKNLEIVDNNQHLLITSFLENEQIQSCIDIDNKSFPRLQQLKKCIILLVAALPNWSKYRAKKQCQLSLDENILNAVCQQEATKLENKLNKIVEQVHSRLLQYRILYNALIARLDDWIIYGIKRENDIAYNHIKQIKKCINQARKSNIKESSNKEINEIYKPYGKISAIHLPIIEQTHKLVTLQQARLLLQDFKTLSVDLYMSYQLFKEYFTRRIRGKMLGQALSSISFDYVQQYFVQDGKINRLQITTAIILYQQNVPLDEDIDAYRQQLIKKATEGKINIKNFIQTKAFFDNRDRARTICQKFLIFQTYRLPDSDQLDIDSLCGTLSQLSRMQVQRFSNLLHNRQ